MSDIINFQKQIKKFCADRDWQQFHNFKDLAISLNLEAAEVLEHFQWKSEREIINHLEKYKTELGEELSDVLYWTLYLADKADIDLKHAFEEKMRKNKIKYPVKKAKGSHRKYTELQK